MRDAGHGGEETPRRLDGTRGRWRRDPGDGMEGARARLSSRPSGKKSSGATRSNKGTCGGARYLALLQDERDSEGDGRARRGLPGVVRARRRGSWLTTGARSPGVLGTTGGVVELEAGGLRRRRGSGAAPGWIGRNFEEGKVVAADLERGRSRGRGGWREWRWQRKDGWDKPPKN